MTHVGALLICLDLLMSDQLTVCAAETVTGASAGGGVTESSISVFIPFSFDVLLLTFLFCFFYLFISSPSSSSSSSSSCLQGSRGGQTSIVSTSVSTAPSPGCARPTTCLANRKPIVNRLRLLQSGGLSQTTSCFPNLPVTLLPVS